MGLAPPRRTKVGAEKRKEKKPIKAAPHKKKEGDKEMCRRTKENKGKSERKEKV